MNDRKINVLVFGASGMVGQGVLRECLKDSQVASVAAIGRTASAIGRKPPVQRDSKLREIVHADLSDYTGAESQLSDWDACFFCLGISSAGLTEEAYRRVTYGFTMAAAKTLVKLNRHMTFIYVSGAGTDSSEAGRIMWARVKGQTENGLLALPFKAAYMLRPGLIQPLEGIKSKTRSYRILYSVLSPFLPMLRAAFPNHIVSTAQVGRAMLNLAKHGYSKRILEIRDIKAAAQETNAPV
jgi:uncharacterized protein YbjT (DUF2867 family)